MLFSGHDIDDWRLELPQLVTIIATVIIAADDKALTQQAIAIAKLASRPEQPERAIPTNRD